MATYTSKFEKGDSIYFIHGNKIVKREVKTVSFNGEFSYKVQLYLSLYNKEMPLDIPENIAFGSTSELAEHWEKEINNQ